MAQTQAIKRRIKSVKNTNQITKAMELVSASKLRRSQAAALRTRPYYNSAREILSRLSTLTDATKDPHFRKTGKVSTRLHVVITSDRGLAGAYNGNVLKLFVNQLNQDRLNGIAAEVIVIGRKGAQVVSRIEDVELIGVYQDIAAQPHPTDIEPILAAIQQRFFMLLVDDVMVHYTHFYSSISAVAETTRLLPIMLEEEMVDIAGDISQAEFEPSPEEVLKLIVPKLVRAEFYQLILESSASEHSMRRMAMKSASDNAGELIDDLTLEYNSARQASITQELAEITGGAAAIS